MITKLSVSLPASLEEFARKRVRDGGYGSISEYFRELIRIDQRLARIERSRHKQIPRDVVAPYEFDLLRHGR
jgi:antitoxin ParD1/3/4